MLRCEIRRWLSWERIVGYRCVFHAVEGDLEYMRLNDHRASAEACHSLFRRIACIGHIFLLAGF